MTSRRFGMFFGSTTTCWVVLRKLSKKWFRHVNPFAAVMFEQDLKGRTRRGVFDPCCVSDGQLMTYGHWTTHCPAVAAYTFGKLISVVF
uniref:Uncharacterized protein n=1 Tax=Triticum urartu TaxID=4572 RepID=A0A8R7QX43_TRIUA